VLKSETVTLMGQNQIGAVSVPALKTALPRRVARQRRRSGRFRQQFVSSAISTRFKERKSSDEGWHCWQTIGYAPLAFFAKNLLISAFVESRKRRWLLPHGRCRSGPGNRAQKDRLRNH
jgi:hypothetical protein